MENSNTNNIVPHNWKSNLNFVESPISDSVNLYVKEAAGMEFVLKKTNQTKTRFSECCNTTAWGHMQKI